MENVLDQLSSLTRVDNVIPQPPVIPVTQEQPIIENTVVQQQLETSEPEPTTGGFESEEDVINYVMQSLQVEGFKPTQQGIDAIVELAKYKVQNIQQEYDIFNRQEILEFKEHLEKGGDIQSFKEIQSLENPYSGIEYTEDNIEVLESLAKHIYVEVQGLAEADAEALIEYKKDNHTLFNFVDETIPKLSQAVEAQNEQKVQQILEQKQQEQKAVQEYTNKMKDALKVNNFGGTKIPDNILPTIEKLSFVDKDGNLGMQDVWNKITPEQEVLLNYFSYCIVNNLPIDYKPINRPTGTSKPIHQMFNKSTEKEASGTIDDLLNALKKR